MDRVGLSERGRSTRSGGVKLQKPEGVIKGFYGPVLCWGTTPPARTGLEPHEGPHPGRIPSKDLVLDRHDFTPYKAACPDAAWGGRTPG